MATERRASVEVGEKCAHKRIGEQRTCSLRRTESTPAVTYWCLDCDRTFERKP